jgi:type II secretory ATPase GspE/PulE/Tfp pilus assembly ATPase PilB-like protein
MTLYEATAIGDFSPLPEGKSQYSYDFIESHGAIKLRESPEELWIGLAADADAAIADTLANFHRKQKVHFRAIDRAELSAYLGAKVAALDAAGALSAASPSAAMGDEERITLDRLANDAPVVNLVNSLCIDGIRGGASDIHIEAQSDVVRVRYRIDGLLRTARTLDKARFAAISSRIKIMANLNIMERRLPQDGRMSVDLGGDAVDLRVSVVPVARGESIVLRLFSKSSSPLTIDRLGFDPSQLALIERMLKAPYGLVLVTGPTGSGKTTTLNAMLRLLSSESLKIITIEDPIECLLEGVNQIQTNERIGLGFDTILRRVLRQDPNVIMVGEIRDSATAELAIRAAMTGRLVLSTLHTNDSLSAIPRLRDMGIGSHLIASVLKGALAQRLVRRVCPSCKSERAATSAEIELLGKYGFRRTTASFGAGCESCGGSGYRGRIVISESYSVEDELEELILREESAARLSSFMEKRGMATIACDGMAKAAAGTTTMSELEREVSL